MFTHVRYAFDERAQMRKGEETRVKFLVSGRCRWEQSKAHYGHHDKMTN
jgi:hypothetical protein